MSSWQQAFGHGSRVFGLAFHPHSPNVIASASEDETVRVWGREASSGDWQQASCCRGHTSEVLRVAWSPDGRLLASGSADHTVRFWSVSTSPTQQSYAGSQVAMLSGHPEEVYAVHFIPDTPPGSSSSTQAQQQQQQQQEVQHTASQLASSSLDSPATAAVAPGGSSSGSRARLLLTASGESLYLWDIEGGQLLQQSAPLPVMQTFPAFAAAVAGRSVQQQQQQQGPQAGTRQKPAPTNSTRPTSSSTSSSQQGQSGFSASSSQGSDDEEEEEQGLVEPPPSYIFGVAVCKETNWAAATCSDGMLRLWDASRAALTEVATVQVHAGQMGSTVSWLPQQPLCVASISKAGQLVLQDVRLLGRPLLQQQLEGPVFDAVWLTGTNPWASPGTPAAAAAAAAVVGGVGSADGGSGAAAGASSSAAAATGGDVGGASSGGVQQLQLVVVGRDSKLRAYSLDAASLQRGMLGGPQTISASHSYSGSLLALAASPDGRGLAAAGEAVEAHTLHPAQQQQQQQHTTPAAVQAPPKRRGMSSARRAGGSTVRAAVDLLNLEVDDSLTGLVSAQAVGSSEGPTAAAAAAAARQPGGHGSAANCAAAAAAALTRAPVFIWSS